MIVFGHNNFKIRTFTPRELNLPHEEGFENIEIQIRQHYAHIFWIPFFPLKKIWAFKRQGDPNLYQLPESIKMHVKSKHEIKTPWYSFALIILAVVGFFGFIGMEKINDINRENNFYRVQAEQKMMIKYPTTGDYYAFSIYEDPKTYKHTGVILKVNSYTDTAIEFASSYDDLYAQNIASYSMDREIKNSGNYSLNIKQISKKDLLELITKDYKDYSEKKLQMAGFDNKYVSFKKMKRQELETL